MLRKYLFNEENIILYIIVGVGLTLLQFLCYKLGLISYIGSSDRALQVFSKSTSLKVVVFISPLFAMFVNVIGMYNISSNMTLKREMNKIKKLVLLDIFMKSSWQILAVMSISGSMMTFICSDNLPESANVSLYCITCGIAIIFYLIYIIETQLSVINDLRQYLSD